MERSVSLCSLRQRPTFRRPAVSDVLGNDRLRPIKKRPSQRSHTKDPTVYSNLPKELLFSEDAVADKMREADRRFRVKQLEAKCATGERAATLRRALKEFFKTHGSERMLRRQFVAADIDFSGELDFDEFRFAVRNYGLRHLRTGALKTLFDSFDGDGSGSISIDEFVKTIGRIEVRRFAKEGHRGSFLERPVASEPKRIGFEATPPTLSCGKLYVGAIYEAKLDILNTGDTDLRFSAKVEKISENAVKIVGKPAGMLPPGLRASIFLEILSRRVGALAVDVVVSTETQVLVVPLRAEVIQKISKDIPSSQSAHKLFHEAFPDFAEAVNRTLISKQLSPSQLLTSSNISRSVETALSLANDDDPRILALMTGPGWKHKEIMSDFLTSVDGKRLPSFLRCVPAAELRRGWLEARRQANSVWPTSKEQWDQVQKVLAEACDLLGSLPCLAECPPEDLRALGLRLRRFKCQAGFTLQESTYFIARGTVLIDDDDKVVAPCYLSRRKNTTAETALEGFSLGAQETSNLVGNVALAMIDRDAAICQFEEDCAKNGGLLFRNYNDPAFIKSIVDFAYDETRHGPRVDFLCRQLSLADTCRAEKIKDDLSTTTKEERTLAFDRCLVSSDDLWRDFIGDDSSKGRPRKKKALLLGANAVTDARLETMVQGRQAALADSDFDKLHDIYGPLADDVAAALKRSFLQDYAESPAYRRWISQKLPLDKFLQRSPDNHPEDIIPSMAFDLPTLRAHKNATENNPASRPSPFGPPRSPFGLPSRRPAH